MKTKKIKHTAILWSTTATDVQARIANLKKWRYERGNGYEAKTVSLAQYEDTEPCLTEDEEEKLHTDITTIVELTDAISDSYKENTVSWLDLHSELLKTQCTEADWEIINNEIQAIIKERQFLNELFVNGNGVAGSSWYRKKGWDQLGAGLKGRMGVIACLYVIKGATEGVVIVSWRVKFLDMGRMFMTPFFGKKYTPTFLKISAI
ncbi:MAG: hypothetical protein IJS00_03695 [Paludibacteraceae bacterium]|nr:hypothetical protein [Paludibacteraceae bacterium]